MQLTFTCITMETTIELQIKKTKQKPSTLNCVHYNVPINSELNSFFPKLLNKG